MKLRKTWYDKIILDDNLSLRYYYIFDDRRHLVGKWVIKDHSSKKYAEISEQAARMICESHDIDFDKDREEVIGRTVKMGDDVQGYRKIILGDSVSVSYETDDCTHTFNFIEESECSESESETEDEDEPIELEIEVKDMKELFNIFETLKRI